MGDGRYYSWAQFSAVVFMTVFMILISISMVLCFYQDFRKNGLKIRLIHFFLGLGGAFRFAEEVLVSIELSYIAKYLECFCIILSLWSISGLFERASRTTHFIYGALTFSTVFLLIISLFHKELFIISYSFSGIGFGLFYLFIVTSWFLYAFWRLFSLKRKAEFFFFFILPVAGHITGALFSNRYGNIGILLLYPGFLFAVYYLSSDLKAYRIGGEVFSNINNLINDAVLILDPANKIIFRNQDAMEADFLKKRC